METADLEATRESLLEVLQLAKLENAHYPTCHWYSSSVLAVKEERLSSSVSLLYRLCELQLGEENTISTYSRSHTDWNEQSFSDTQLDILGEILPDIGPHDLKAKILDILWIRRRNVEHARSACEEFINAGISCIKSDCHEAGSRFGRGLRLVKSLGKNETLIQPLTEQVLSALQADDISEVVLVNAIDELLAGRLMDLKVLLELAEKGVSRATKPWVIQRFYQLVRRCAVLLRDKDKEVSALKSISQSLEKEADESEIKALQTHKLKAAIHTLRGVGSDCPDIDRLHTKLLEVQTSLGEEFRSVPVIDLDLTKNFQNALYRIHGKGKFEAIAELIAATDLPDSQELEKRAVENIRDFPFQNMFFVEKMSTTLKTATSIPAAGGDELPQERVFYQMLREYGIFFEVVGAGTILPMIEELNLRHHITYLDIAQLVDRSPYIPDHHHDFFCSGIIAGIQGRMIEALHCLVPQVEAVFRKVLSDHSVVVSSLDHKSSQREFDLNKILHLKELEEIFHKDTITVFRAIFTEQAGLNLRNELSHGMITTGRCFSYSSVFAWWVIVWLVLHPVANEILLRARSPDSPSQPPTNP